MISLGSMPKDNCSARRGPFFSREGQLFIFRHQTLWFVLASATLSHRPCTFQIHRSGVHWIQCPTKFKSVMPAHHLQKLLRKMQSSALRLAVEVVHRESIQVSFSLPKAHHSCRFIFLRPMYMVAVLAQYDLYMFECQFFFA